MRTIQRPRRRLLEIDKPATSSGPRLQVIDYKQPIRAPPLHRSGLSAAGPGIAHADVRPSLNWTGMIAKTNSVGRSFASPCWLSTRSSRRRRRCPAVLRKAHRPLPDQRIGCGWCSNRRRRRFQNHSPKALHPRSDRRFSCEGCRLQDRRLRPLRSPSRRALRPRSDLRSRCGSS